MAVDVVMPQMGESVFEGTVTKWLRKPGESVRQDEPLFEISTDKVDAEIPSPATGVLKEIKVAAGQTVQVNTVVATLEAGDGASAPAPAPPAEKPAAAPAPPPPPAPAAVAAPPAPPAPAPAPAAAAAPAGEDVRSSPLVRRLAAEHNVNLAAVPASGDGGRVSKRDLMNYIESGAAASPAPAAPAPAAAPAYAPAPPAAPQPAPPPVVYAPGSVRIEPLSKMRKLIADHMVMSKHTSPHVYSVFAVDATAISQAREREKAHFEASTGQRLTFMPFFCQAVVDTLHQFPVLNSSMQEDSIVYKNDINLGIAVSLEWGLIVPVIKHAEEKNFLGLQRAINDLAVRARGKKLLPDEVKDGTFSISNYGIYGGLIGMPIINQPQVAILGIGGIHKEAVVVNDAIAIRSIVHLTLSFDHRVVDGATADQSMAFMRDRIEGWNSALL